MAANINRPYLWENDVMNSVAYYNDWYMQFAPNAFRSIRGDAYKEVMRAFEVTRNLTDICVETLKSYPSILSVLRMATCPPIARDRLIGLAQVNKNLVKTMEEGRFPRVTDTYQLDQELERISRLIKHMIDPDIFVWLQRGDSGTLPEVSNASIVISDRFCSSLADPLIRNEQEQRQLSAIKLWLVNRGYRELMPGEASTFTQMPNGTFSFRTNIAIQMSGGNKVNIPIDAVIKRKNAIIGELPVLFEAKSAGDFTNTNKRRKEEAQKVQQLRSNFGPAISFNLFLCGYFDAGYLNYEAAEGIDWVWEHRIDDMQHFGF